SPGIGHAQFVHPDELEEDAVVQVKQHRWIPQIILKGKESLRCAVGLDEMQVRLAEGLTEQVAIGAKCHVAGNEDLEVGPDLRHVPGRAAGALPVALEQLTEEYQSPRRRHDE